MHGLYADASSWAKVIPLLQAKGLHVTAVQNPTTSLEADVDAVKRTLALQDGPTLLVAHSYGGMVISQAGDDPKVKGLVYIVARAPDAGEDCPGLTRKFAPAPAGAGSQRVFRRSAANGQTYHHGKDHRGGLARQADLVRVAAPLSLQNRRSLNSVVMKILIIEDEAKTACLETATGRRLRSGAMAALGLGKERAV
ncbi:alpha/beta hydrolase [Pseudomonas syringae]|uniref:alpha/beta hydrolase n=1 Tax=Pseudomonas syringae TaxID=317 RepID=UPI0012FD47FE|nr:alpha/beta fold hydrolase [Pseudomonas syringae]